jgi:hypothetical protein
LFAIGLIAAVIILTLLAAPGIGNSSENKSNPYPLGMPDLIPSSTNTPPGYQGINPYLSEIKQFEAQLTNPSLPEQSRKDLEFKIEGLGFRATQWVLGKENHTPYGEKTNPPLPTPIPPTQEPDGIYDRQLIPFPFWGVHEPVRITNSWEKTTDTRRYIVMAGHLGLDPEQGIVVMNDINFDYHLYLTPRKSGDVKIVEEDWPYLLLEAENGDIFYFDVVGETFRDE